jgi:hypothetical protein
MNEAMVRDEDVFEFLDSLKRGSELAEVNPPAMLDLLSQCLRLVYGQTTLWLGATYNDDCRELDYHDCARAIQKIVQDALEFTP